MLFLTAVLVFSTSTRIRQDYIDKEFSLCLLYSSVRVPSKKFSLGGGGGAKVPPNVP